MISPHVWTSIFTHTVIIIYPMQRRCSVLCISFLVLATVINLYTQQNLVAATIYKLSQDSGDGTTGLAKTRQGGSLLVKTMLLLLHKH